MISNELGENLHFFQVPHHKVHRYLNFHYKLWHNFDREPRLSQSKLLLCCQEKRINMGRYTGKKCRLMAMFSLTASFFVVEIVVGHITNSMALIADSFHMLSDIAALVIAFISVKMAPKSWDKNTYGWARAEVLGKLTRSKKRT